MVSTTQQFPKSDFMSYHIIIILSESRREKFSRNVSFDVRTTIRTSSCLVYISLLSEGRTRYNYGICSFSRVMNYGIVVLYVILFVVSNVQTRIIFCNIVIVFLKWRATVTAGHRRRRVNENPITRNWVRAGTATAKTRFRFLTIQTH